jgi:hypothetical protein
MATKLPARGFRAGGNSGVILWWDGLGEKRGSGPQRRNGPVTSLPIAGKDGIPERMVRSHFRGTGAGAGARGRPENVTDQLRFPKAGKDRFANT